MHSFHLGHAEYILVLVEMWVLPVLKVGRTLGNKAGESEEGFYNQRDATVSPHDCPQNLLNDMFTCIFREPRTE